MSNETSERQLELVNIDIKLAVAEKQIADGVPLLDCEDVLKKLKAKHGAKRACGEGS